MRKFGLIERDRSRRYILMMVVSFATTVVVTRFYLELTGYPRMTAGSD